MTVQVSIYGFLSDGSLRKPLTFEANNNANQGYGYLFGEPANYLVARGTYSDLRTKRLIPLNEGNVTPIVGKSGIELDLNKVDETALNELTNEERNRIFNIIDLLAYDQEDTSKFETILTDDLTTYVGYKANSFSISTESASVSVTGTDNTQYDHIVRNWVEFTFVHGNVEFFFHIWISLLSFAKYYPYTTITAVIPPYDIKALVDPSYMLQQGNIKVLANSSSYIFNKANIETLTRDQNGIYTFNTKYVLNSSTSVQLPFALAYCGAKVPTSLECRKAIREYLEKETSFTTDVLAAVLPEIYVVCVFYLTPLWDVYSARTERDVYNSIWSIKTIRNKAAKAYIDQDADWIDEHLEILTQAQSKTLVLSLPDVSNEKHFSVLELHPTYQDYSAQVPGWKYMTDTTQEFAGKFIRAMAVLEGKDISEEFIVTEISGVKYLSFSVGDAEYLLMYPDSYSDLMSKK